MNHKDPANQHTPTPSLDRSISSELGQFAQSLREILDRIPTHFQDLKIIFAEEASELLLEFNKALQSIFDNLKKIINDCDHFVKTNPKGIPEHCRTGLTVLISRLNSLYKTSLPRLSAKNHIARQSGINIFKDLCKDLKNVSEKAPTNTATTKLFNAEQEESLRTQQGLLEIRRDAKPTLLYKKFLERLNEVRNLAHGMQVNFPRVFISYARPTSTNTHEHWIQDFLRIFRDHLQQVGIRTYLDTHDSTYGYSANTHMHKIQKCTHAILIGTLSLTEKDKGIGHMVQTELNLLREALKTGKPRVIPMLLSGSYENSFPKDFLRYTAIEDFNEPSYLQRLQTLIEFLVER